jgi:hypothetical protein
VIYREASLAIDGFCDGFRKLDQSTRMVGVALAAEQRGGRGALSPAPVKRTDASPA